MAPIAKAAKSTNKTTPPRAFEFSVGHPIGLTALDVDLIKVRWGIETPITKRDRETQRKRERCSLYWPPTS